MTEKARNFHTVHFGDLLSVAIICISIIGISIICISVRASVISSIIVPTTSTNTELGKKNVFFVESSNQTAINCAVFCKKCVELNDITNVQCNLVTLRGKTKDSLSMKKFRQINFTKNFMMITYAFLLFTPVPVPTPLFPGL